MALPKLFNLITWHNNTTPAINEDNLNAMSEAIDNIDDRVIGLAGTITEDVAQIQEDIEEIEGYMDVIDDKVDAATTAANNANTSKNAAASQALVSEGYAKGTQNGTPVGSTSPYYHNNAEYFMEEARTFTPEGYQDLVEEVSDLNTEVNSVKTAFVNNVNNNGSKNILPVKEGGSSQNNVTFSTNANGIVTVNANSAASANTYYMLTNASSALDYIPFKAGTYVFSVEAVNAGSYISDVQIVQYDPSTETQTLLLSTTTHEEFTLADDCYLIFRIRVFSGKQPSNTKYYPMVCTKLDYDLDPTYVPYAKPNRQLTEDSLTCEDFSKVGAVNIAKITAVTQTVNGVTFTIDPDTGKVTASNNAASANIRLVLATMTLKAGVTYKLSDTKDGKATRIVNDTLAIRLPGSTWLAATDGIYSVLYTPSVDTEVQLIRSVNSGLTPYSECYPMITPMLEYSGPFVPYAKTNKQLTEDVSDINESLARKLGIANCPDASLVFDINISGGHGGTNGSRALVIVCRDADHNGFIMLGYYGNQWNIMWKSLTSGISVSESNKSSTGIRLTFDDRTLIDVLQIYDISSCNVTIPT